MSKKRKSLMDGYFDNINGPIEINPFVAATTLTKKEDIALDASIAPINHDIKHEPNHKSNIKSGDFNIVNNLNNNSGTIPELKRNNSVTDSGTIPELKRNNEYKNKIDNTNNISNIDFNSGTIPELKRNNSGTIPELKRNNSVTDSGIKAEQFRNSTLIQKKQTQENQQFRNNSGTDSGTCSGIKAEQFRNNSNKKVNQEIHFLKLSGNRKKILETIFSLCQKNGSLTTNPLSRDSFERLTGIDGEVIRVTCNRLISEGYLRKKESKRGAGGFLIFEINNIVYSQILENPFRNNSGIKAEQFRNNSGTDSGTDSGTLGSSKLVSNNINSNYLSDLDEMNSNLKNRSSQRTSFSSPQDDSKSPSKSSWFRDLDFSAVYPIGPMQVNSSIRILVQEKLHPDQVQEFLNRFKNWLATQQKIQNPLAIFCDRLKEFATEGDSAILSVMTDQEREIEAQFIEETKKAKAQIQLIEKAQIEKSKNQEENLRTEAEVEFEKWYNSASDVELAQMAPPIDIAPLRSGLHKISTKSAFMSKILLEKQK